MEFASLYCHSHSRSNTGNQGNAENDDKDFPNFECLQSKFVCGSEDNKPNRALGFLIPIYKEMAISNVSRLMNQRFKARKRKREQHVYLYKGTIVCSNLHHSSSNTCKRN